eukprot:353226-Chlamydomonas_euryale.AAC.13
MHAPTHTHTSQTPHHANMHACLQLGPPHFAPLRRGHHLRDARWVVHAGGHLRGSCREAGPHCGAGLHHGAGGVVQPAGSEESLWGVGYMPEAFDVCSLCLFPVPVRPLKVLNFVGLDACSLWLLPVPVAPTKGLSSVGLDACSPFTKRRLASLSPLFPWPSFHAAVHACAVDAVLQLSSAYGCT